MFKTPLSTLTILKFPDPRLRQIALPVVQVDDEIRVLVRGMFEAMYREKGIGLAAVQVNILKQVIVIDTTLQGEMPLALINPLITRKEGELRLDEGCLSLPGEFEPVKRAEKVWCTALDEEGVEREIEAEGLLAVCIQHEIDHLQGKLFVDHLTQLKRSRINKRLNKQNRSRLEAKF